MHFLDLIPWFDAAEILSSCASCWGIEAALLCQTVHLLVGALQLQGSCAIKQLYACLQVSWVQPRVLTLEQAEGLKTRLDNWISKVGATSMILQPEQLAAIA